MIINKQGALQCAPMELVKVATATGNFSDANKIGQGGFGIVYKVLYINSRNAYIYHIIVLS